MKCLDKLIQSEWPYPKDICKSNQEPPNLYIYKVFQESYKEQKRK